MIPDQRAVLIKKYKEGYQQVVDALRGISAAELDFRRAPGKWSAREIVHHLADSETTSAIRFRKLLTEEHPIIQGYDQDEYAIRLRYNARDMAPALEAFHAARSNTAQLLERMSDDDWQRKGEHK